MPVPLRVALLLAFAPSLSLAGEKGPSILPAGEKAPHVLPAGEKAPNILLVVADDLGVYELACYGEGSDYPATPTLDELAQGGVLFRNCWSNPLCSPTRATIQTGRYSVETGMGGLLTGAFGLSLSELTVAEALEPSQASYTCALFGKWHLSNLSAGSGGLLAPNLSGYDHAVWTWQNLVSPTNNYFHWTEIEKGVENVRDGYVTSLMVDRALEWVTTVPEPWFAVLSFHAAHEPFHAPPDGLFTTDVAGAGDGNYRPLYKAMIESLDHELGRFLAGLGEHRATTEILFVGDNGSPWHVIAPPGDPGKAKATLFEGGINVPLIVQGPSVTAPGSVCDALVNTTDLFATIVELGGTAIPPEVYTSLKLNTISVVPYLSAPELGTLRTVAYADTFKPAGFSATTYQGAARDERFKLHMGVAPTYQRFYDLENDPFEEMNLLEVPLSPAAQLSYDTLREVIKAQLASYAD